jgi:hypothetical protein
MGQKLERTKESAYMVAKDIRLKDNRLKDDKVR